MRRVYLLASVLALAAGNLCANSALTLACSLNVSGLPGPFSGLGGVGGNGCFSTSFSNVTTLDSVNWGAPTETSGQSGLGDATPGNSFPIGVLNPVQYRTATTAGDQVTVQLPATYQGTATSVTRADNFGLQWNGSAWVAPGTPGTQNLAGFPGHFNSAVIPGSAAGDHLLELTNGGPLELSFLGTATGPVLGVWFQMASLAGQNSLFVAEVQAFDKDGNSIGTYTLTESGAYGSGGQCASLSFSPPLPCNDAPYVGFYDPEGRIYSVYVSAFDPSDLTTPIGFAISSLRIDQDPVPEPAVPLMIGGGLAAMALYRRKRLLLVG